MQDVVFYDGVCGLCDQAVQFLIRHDLERKFRYLPLQSPRAEAMLAAFPDAARDRAELNSLIFLTHGQVYTRSSAVVQMLKKLPQPWPALANFLWLLPKPIRNLAYGTVASVRYRVFGKFDTCPLPSAETRALFLNDALTVFHLASQADWEAAQSKGDYRVPSLEKEGFIHCSDADQIPRIGRSHFSGRKDVLLLEIDPAKAGARVIYEDLYEGHELFPHLYGPLPLSAVVHVSPFDPDAS